MRAVFLPALLHEPTGDPGLWIDLLDEGRSLLLDMGQLTGVPTRKLMRIERVVVTHTHMDHFIGFDHLLRLVLGRERELVLSGPPGFIAQVCGRVDAYTWNVIRSYPVRLLVEEIDGETLRSVRITGAGGMCAEALPDRAFSGVLHAERLFTLHVRALDHGIPVLGVALRETEHLSVNRDRVLRLGLVPGDWLRELKQVVRRQRIDEGEIDAATADGGVRRYSCRELAGQVIHRSPGQRIAYLTDLRHTAGNVAAAVALAGDADLLVCETAFLHEDRQLARDRGHLTARQAGELARAAGVGKLAPFHLSPRYQGREQELFDEAAAAFGGPVVRLPTCGAT